MEVCVVGRLQRILDPTDPLIRYLLDEISDYEKNSIEERLKFDEDYQKKLSETEERLIIAYVNCGLSETNRRLFENNFLCTEERKQKHNLVQKYESSTPPPLRASVTFLIDLFHFPHLLNISPAASYSFYYHLFL